MTKNTEKEMNKMDAEAPKQKRKVVASYGTDSDLQRLQALKPFLITEWEDSNRVELSDSEAIRRCIYELWKNKVAKL